MTYRAICEAQLPIDEGSRAHVYRDSLGIETIGIGRNLQNGLSDDEILYLFKNDLDKAEKGARAICPSFDTLSDARKAVLINMCFNMGQARVAGFIGMFGAIAAKDWNAAAQHMLASKWAVQVGARAQRLAKAMREG